MLKNNIVHISTSKLIGATILPNSILLITGIVIWKLWRNKHSQLQTTTDELKNEIEYLKEQMNEIQTEKHKYLPQTSSSGQTDATQIGLFEFLIEDNIQLRKDA